jgi:hypothetical protein
MMIFFLTTILALFIDVDLAPPLKLPLFSNSLIDRHSALQWDLQEQEEHLREHHQHLRLKGLLLY